MMMLIKMRSLIVATLFLSNGAWAQVSDSTQAPVSSVSRWQMQTACRLDEVKINRSNPYQFCTENIAAVETRYRSCVGDQPFSKSVQNEFREEYQLALREQIKILMARDLFYTSRITPDSSFYEDAWLKLRQRWTARLAQLPKVMELDRRTSLGRDRCTLHFLAGQDCGELPAKGIVDLIAIEKERALEGFSNRQARRSVPVRLSYDLFESVLLLDLLKSESDEIQALNKNYLFSYYPELAIDAGFYRSISDLARRSGFYFEALARITKAKQSGNGASFEEINKVVLDILESSAEHGRISESTHRLIESSFYRVKERISNELIRLNDRAIAEPDWLFDQDYLLFGAADLSLRLGQRSRAQLLQTMVCHNLNQDKKWKERKRTFGLVVGGVALATGVGAIFEVGIAVSTPVIIATLSLANMASAIDVYSTFQQRQTDRALFLLQGTDYLSLKEADEAFGTAVPWAVANVAFTAPAILLRQIALGRAAAVKSNDQARLRQLDRYQKLVVRTTVGAGGIVTATQAPSVYEAIQSLRNEGSENSNVGQK